MAAERDKDVIDTYSEQFDQAAQDPEASSELFIQREETRIKYGPRLGDAMLFSILAPMMEPDQSKVQEIYDALAEEIANKLEGSHEDKVLGVRALLEMQHRIIQGLSQR